MSSQRVKQNVCKVFIEGKKNPFFLSGTPMTFESGSQEEQIPNRSYIKTFAL